MNSSNKIPRDIQRGEQPESRPNWWEESLSRREAGKRIAGIGIGAAALVSAASLIGCGDDETDVEETAATARDALDVQKESGWNVGADDQSLSFRNASATDSRNVLDWNQYRDAEKLRQAWLPKDSEWAKHVSPELIMSLGQPSLKSSAQPVHSSTMDEAYARGLGMKALLAESKDAGTKAIIVDLPGPEAVAYAAALSDVAEPVLTFDNWPHPKGVVPSHETLGALLYYANEVEANKEKRPDNAPVLFVMDSNRLTEYQDSGDAFDNRYVALLPTADVLKKEGITGVIYAVPDDNRTAELDDLNEDFVSYRNSGIDVTMMPLTDFRPVSAEMIAEHGEVKGDTSGSNRTYYYGGHPHYSPFFFSYFPMFIPLAAYNYGSLRSPGNLRRPTYAPSRRPTMFSSRTVGGGQGVGKQKPTGFGRVSTRNVGGRTVVGSGGSSGRSGSFGRSGGRSSSGG